MARTKKTKAADKPAKRVKAVKPEKSAAKKKTGIKMSTKIVLACAAVVIAAGGIVGGIFLARGRGPKIVTSRYETVSARKAANEGNSAPVSAAGSEGESDLYVMTSSGVSKDKQTNYYLFYMGYVKNAPVAYKTAYSYDGITPITISYEKSAATEKATEDTVTVIHENTNSNSVSVGAEMEFSTGFPLVTKAEWTVSASYGHEWINTVSTENTHTTIKTEMESISESISATIGEHNEKPGKYRYALFGLTDVYYQFTVKASDSSVIKTDAVYSARGSSLAWGIDFEPNALGEFGKTGDGEKFTAPVIDFSKITPNEKNVIDGPEAPPPPTSKKTAMSLTTGELQGKLELTGDKNIDSEKGKATTWEFRITDLKTENPQTTEGTVTYAGFYFNYEYTVKENKGDHSTIKYSGTHHVNMSAYKIIKLNSPPSFYASGNLTGELRGWYELGWWNYGFIRKLEGVLDSSGGDDAKIIACKISFLIEFEESLE